MAAETGFIGRVLTEARGWASETITSRFLRSPNRAASGDVDTAPPPVSQGLVSRDLEHTFIPDLYLNSIKPNDDSILVENGHSDGLVLYDRLLDDDKAMSACQKRRLGITAKDWEVAPGDENDPRSVQAADDLRAMLKGIGWDRITGNMWYAIWYGYAVAEGMYTTKVHDGRRIIWLDDIVVPDRKWFGFTHGGELRMMTPGGQLGEDRLPPAKFWALRTGATHDFAFYGLGLAHWCYWPIFFKRAATKFWALYLEKYAQPTALGGFAEGADDETKGNLLSALIAIGQDRAVIVPEALVEKVKYMEPTRSGAGVSSYKDFTVEQNDAIDRVVLGQPGTSRATSGGLNSNQAEVQSGEQDTLVKADSDLISEGFNNTFAKWLTRWNHGEDVAPPTVYRLLDDAEDLNTVADRDTKLKGLGWVRTEESFTSTYGEGYEKAPDPVVDPATGLPVKPGQKPPAANENTPAAKAAKEFGVNDVAPLYVSRALKGDKLRKWAEKNGLKPFVPDPHVTVLNSKNPVDWFDMGDTWAGPEGELIVEAGGPRKLERLGDEGAVVLRFASPYLRYRHDSMVERGASHDYPEYLPHVTLTYDAKDVDLDKIEPFEGELRFGPEIFAPIKTDETDADKLDFAATELDAIDRLVAHLAEDTSPLFVAMADGLRDSLQGVTTVEGARVAMLEAMEKFPVTKLAEKLGLPYLATRVNAATGADKA